MSFVLFVSLVSLATSQDRIKGTKKLGGGLFGARLLSSSVSPIGAMFHDPIKQGSFKADVFAGFFAFNPLMLQNLCPLSKELLVERRTLNESSLIFFRRRHRRFFFHKIWDKSTKSTHWNQTAQPHHLFSLVCARRGGCITTAKFYEWFLTTEPEARNIEPKKYSSISSFS